MRRIENAPFKPRSIDLSKNLIEAFAKFEVEQDVIRMIKYFNIKNEWHPVSLTWLNERAGEFKDHDFQIERGIIFMDFLDYLVNVGCMIKEDGWYYPTDRFFRRLSEHLKPKK